MSREKVRQELRDVQSDINTKFLSLVDTIGFGIIHVDVSGRFCDVNHAMCTMLGYSYDELLTKTFQELTYPEDLASDLLIKEALDRGEIEKLSLEKRYLCKDGSPVWVNLTVAVVREDDVVLYYVGIVENIDEKKKLRLELEEQSALLRSVLDESPYPIVLKDYQGKFLLTNQACADLYNTTVDEMLGKDDTDYIPEKNKNQGEFFRHNVRDIMDRGETTIVYEQSTDVKTGDVHHYRSIKKPFVCHNGEKRILVLAYDITDIKKAEEMLQLYQRALESTNEGVVITTSDARQTITYTNPAFERLTGYKREEVLGKNCRFLNAPNRNQPILKEIKEAISNFQPISAELLNYRKDGTPFWNRLHIDPIYDDEGRVTHFIGVQEDISARKLDDLRLKQSSNVFQTTLEGVLITDAYNTIVNVNPAFSKITGYSREEVIGQKPSILKSGRQIRSFYRAMWDKIDATGGWTGEVWNRRKNGEIYAELLTISTVKNENDQIENYIAVFSDITALKQSQDKLDFLAHHDPLTQLPNRLLLKARIEHSINVSQRMGNKVAVCFMDLDNFKNINDSYGHTTGDGIIIEVAERIGKLLRKDDTLARLGGDEFVFVLDNIKDGNDAGMTAGKILASFEEPFRVGKGEFAITASVGIALFPEDGSTTETLIKNADAAMYKAKDEGKNAFKFYNNAMTASSFERLLFETALKTAVKEEEFQVFYQPKISLSSGEVRGVEALVRWRHPSMGIVSPDRFIPLAEETRLIIPIGEQVLLQACRDVVTWYDEGLFDGTVAINVSGVQIEHSDFIATLKHSLETTHAKASMLEIEITESMIMKKQDHWIGLLQEIKDLGIAINMDDFGTGYSSLSHLRKLPIDTLKIDRSFVMDIPKERDACAVATTVIALARAMGMKTVAEGVETQEQETFLKAHGCRHGQGYFYAKPMDAQSFKAWLITYDHHRMADS